MPLTGHKWVEVSGTFRWTCRGDLSGLGGLQPKGEADMWLITYQLTSIRQYVALKCPAAGIPTALDAIGLGQARLIRVDVL